VAEKDLVAYWRFDNDSWKESVNNANPGRPHGQAKFIVFRVAGSHAAYFDGKGDYMKMKNSWNTFGG
jgi:hypothetical protein